MINTENTTMVVYAPVKSRSGYGDHSREIVRALIQMNRWDIKIIPCPWGGTPLTAETPDLDPLLIPNLAFQPDIWVMVTVPTEFNTAGKYKNIGITAGVETTVCDKSWIEGCNRMDLVITTSEHSKQVFESTEWTSNDKRHTIKLEVPCVTLIEGLREDIWSDKVPPSKDVDVLEMMRNIKPKKNFLFVGHWLKGGHRHDRKDVGGLIEAYRDAFKDVPSFKQPGLILKTSTAGFSLTDRYNLLERIRSIYDSPNIYLIHGDLSETQMRAVYSHPKVTAFVSFTHGEGYGRPLQEAAACGVPIICPNWSGQVDFLKGRHIPLMGELKNVDPSAAWDNMILKESQWFYVDEKYAQKVMKKVIDKSDIFKQKSAKIKKDIQENFMFSNMVDELSAIFDKYAPVKMQTLSFG